MDTVSGAQAAAELGTTIPRVVRAAERLGMDKSRGPGGRWSLTPAQLRRLRSELGVTPRIAGLSAIEIKVLAALRQAPLGLVSVRAVAARARVSPTAASRALRDLEERDLVYSEQVVLAMGRARTVQLWHANLLHPNWTRLASSLREVRPAKPRSDRKLAQGRVPVRLRHLFWNANPAQLDLKRGGAFIARRLLRTMDPEGLAWGARHLKAADWREGARARGLDDQTRALAENLAKQSPA